MPTANEIAAQFRQRLLQRETQATRALLGSYGRVLRRLTNEIGTLEAEILKLPEDQRKGWKVTKLGRWRALKEQIASEINGYAAVVRDRVEQDLGVSIAEGFNFARSSVGAMYPDAYQAQVLGLWQHMDPVAMEQALGYFQPGSPLLDRLALWGDDAAGIVEGALTNAIARGYSPLKWAGALKSLGQPGAWAINFARTVQLNAYRAASHASYRRNSHVVKGWTWSAHHGPRTCMSCLALDGSFHTLDEEMDDHHQGRCSPSPVTYTLRELGFDVDEEPREPEQTGREWFESLDEKAQEAQFKNGKLYEAWKSGEAPWGTLSTRYEDVAWGKMRRQATYAEAIGTKVPA